MCLQYPILITSATVYNLDRRTSCGLCFAPQLNIFKIQLFTFVRNITIKTNDESNLFHSLTPCFSETNLISYHLRAGYPSGL